MRILTTLLLVLLAMPASAQIRFSANFDDPNAGGTNRYGFAAVNAFVNGGDECTTVGGNCWTLDHLPNGGDQGTGDGAARMTLRAGYAQYELGWQSGSLGSAWSAGQSIFIRLRVRFPAELTATQSFRLKFIDWTSVGSTSRQIGFLKNSGNDGGCGLGSYTDEYGGGVQQHHLRQDYGLSPGVFGNRYLGFAFMGGDNSAAYRARRCAAPPIMMTDVANTGAMGYPGYTHDEFGTQAGQGVPASETGGWYHLQFEMRCGTAGNAYQKGWANQNAYDTPTQLQNPLYSWSGDHYGSGQGSSTAALDCDGWHNGIELGSFLDLAPQGSDIVIDLDDFEVSTTFDANWFPADGPEPGRPVRLRIRGAELAGLLLIAPVGWWRWQRKRESR